jgi:hypothetical protein
MSEDKHGLDAIDQMNQIAAELHVAWCALSNPNHAVECVDQIAEHINGLRLRLEDTIASLQAGLESR